MLHDCPAYNNVWVAGDGVVSIGAAPPVGRADARPLAYTGVQVVDRKIFRYIPAQGPYDLVQAWREALKAGERLAYLRVSGHFWQDLGTPANYLEAHRRLLAGAWPRLAGYFPGLTDPLMGPGARIGAGVRFGGGVCLGANVARRGGGRLEKYGGVGPGGDQGQGGVGRLHRGRRGGGERFSPGAGSGGVTESLNGAFN